MLFFPLILNEIFPSFVFNVVKTKLDQVHKKYIETIPRTMHFIELIQLMFY